MFGPERTPSEHRASHTSLRAQVDIFMLIQQSESAARQDEAVPEAGTPLQPLPRTTDILQEAADQVPVTGRTGSRTGDCKGSSQDRRQGVYLCLITVTLLGRATGPISVLTPQRRALTALRQRKFQEGLLTKTDGQLQTLQELVRSQPYICTATQWHCSITCARSKLTHL